MTSPWLKDYVLEELGSELRNPTTLGANTTRGARIGTAATAMATATATATTPRSRSFSERGSDRVRLVRILARGQGDGSVHRTNGNANGNGNGNAHGTDWWDIRKRGASPNLSLHTNAWLLVSDGSHSAKAYLEVRALKQIFDRDQENHKNNHNHNHNESLFFGRGCCVLLRDYSLDCGSFGGDRESGSGNDNVSGNVSGSDSVVFKVSSLEPKPGFGHHNNHGSTTIRPVMEEIDVLYGLRFLARKRQLEASAAGHGDQSAARKTAIRAMVGRVARDWDVAFGRLSRGLLRTTSATTSATATATATTAHGRTTVSSEADVMELAERLSSTEEAIREWEAAKTEFGIDTNIDIDADADTGTGTGTDANVVDDETAAEVEVEVEVEASENRTATAPTNTNAVRIRKTTTDSGGELRNGDRGDNEDGSENDDDDDDDDDDEDEDPSRLFIQNVLATQEEEEDEDEDEDEDEENEPSNLLLTQEEEKSPKTYSEKPVLPATRSPEKSGRNINKRAIGDEEEDDKQSPSSKAMSCKLPAEQSPRKPGGTNTEDDEEEDERSVRAMRRKRSPVNQRQQQSEDATLRTPMKPRFKRPRAGSSDSGTLSRCTLDEAIDPSNRSAEWTKSTRKLLRRHKQQQQQQQQRENQQELLQKSQTVWEFVKAQLFEPGRTTIHTSPEEIIGNHNNNKNINDDDDELLLLATPTPTPTRTRTPIPMHRSMTPAATTTRGSSAFGSGDSAGTSLTFTTTRTQHSLRVVNTASAEYYRRYGLTRWLNRNTFRQDDNNNSSDEDTDDCY